MRTLTLVSQNTSMTDLEWMQSGNRLAFLQGLRVAFLTVVLLGLQGLQIAQGTFINIDLFVPSYGLLTVSFLLNGLYLLLFDKASRFRWPAAAIMAYDALAITGFLYISGANRSLLLFLFLLNILLSGLVFDRVGAVLLAVWTSLLYSLLNIFGPDVSTQNLFFALTINNLAFFSVAYLSGSLSEQLSALGQEVKVRDEAIEALEDLNELIVDNIATGLLTVDLNFEISHSNRAALNILDDVRLTGKNLKHIFPDLFLKLEAGLFYSQESLHRFEFPYRNSKQEKLIIEVIISQLRSSEGENRGYLLLLQDLTQVKNLELAFRQQEKLAAVGQLAAGIAHEIRNPLASISGSIQLLAANYSTESEENAKLMRITLKEIDRLNLLISEFLEYVRPEIRLDDPININSLMKEVLDMCKVNKTLRAEVEQQIQFNSYKIILGNYNKLKQALLNIVINAYQAMDKTPLPVLTVQSYDRDESVVLVIRDNGIGMSEEVLRRMFEPFHTTKSNGTGLGLAITHKVLESHEARVFVDSEVGKGTVFTLEFPAADDSYQDELKLVKQA